MMGTVPNACTFIAICAMFDFLYGAPLCGDDELSVNSDDGEARGPPDPDPSAQPELSDPPAARASGERRGRKPGFNWSEVQRARIGTSKTQGTLECIAEM